jgi:hypothetical protein
MSEEEMKDLRTLDGSRFDEREHIALCWVRAVLTDPEGAPRELEERFARAFTPREREYVVAAMKGMYFYNLAGNTLITWARRLFGLHEDGEMEACRLEI